MQALTGTDTAVTSVMDMALISAAEADDAAPPPSLLEPAPAPVPALAVPAIDVLPALVRGGPSARDLVLPLVLLAEFLAGLLAGVVF